MKIDYLANVRLPTTRAHGIQIMKTCEAFARQGADVRLIVPDKHHTIEGTSDPFAYYDVERIFEVVRVPTLDTLGRTEALGILGYALDTTSFVISLALSSSVRSNSVLYARDPELFLPFLTRRRCIEAHSMPSNLFSTTLLRSTACVVAITKHLKDDLVRSGVPQKKLLVAPDGVDLERFATPESRGAARERLGLAVVDKLALYIGRLDGWKGLDTLYRAAEFLPEHVTIAVIGGQPGEFEQLAPLYPRIKFIGPRPYTELADNQAAADVLILPNTGKEQVSSRHTSPLKLFSYMASGVPIVASDLPSLREVLSEDNAVLVEPDNALALAEAIQATVTDVEHSAALARKALIDVRAYTWDARAQAILSILKTL